MSFFSFSFLLFPLVFAGGGGFQQEKERESARGQIFFSSFEHNKKKKKYVFCLRSKSRADVRYKNRSSKQTTNALCLSSSWAFSSLHLKPLWHFYSRARNIFYYGFHYFLSSFFGFERLFFSFFFFLLRKKNRGGSLVLVFPEKEKEEEEEKEFFLSSKVFSLLFSSLFFTLFSLCAHQNTSHRIFSRHTSTTHHKTLIEIASGT